MNTYAGVCNLIKLKISFKTVIIYYKTGRDDWWKFFFLPGAIGYLESIPNLLHTQVPQARPETDEMVQE